MRLKNYTSLISTKGDNVVTPVDVIGITKKIDR